jgi:hypothetical protein
MMQNGWRRLKKRPRKGNASGKPLAQSFIFAYITHEAVSYHEFYAFTIEEE